MWHHYAILCNFIAYDTPCVRTIRTLTAYVMTPVRLYGNTFTV